MEYHVINDSDGGDCHVAATFDNVAAAIEYCRELNQEMRDVDNLPRVREGLPEWLDGYYSVYSGRKLNRTATAKAQPVSVTRISTDAYQSGFGRDVYKTVRGLTTAERAAVRAGITIYYDSGRPARVEPGRYTTWRKVKYLPSGTYVPRMLNTEELQSLIDAWDKVPPGNIFKR